MNWTSPLKTSPTRYGFGLGGNSTATLEKLLADLHGVRVVRHQRNESGSGELAVATVRSASCACSRSTAICRSRPRAFQLATQFCELQFGELIPNILRDAGLKSPAAHAVARVGLSQLRRRRATHAVQTICCDSH